MAAPKTTIWNLDPHSRAKHEILERYLKAWMPILSQGGFPEIVYIDGFAGPGVYSKGEDGSPIIALNTAVSYEPPLRAKLQFLFVEAEADRANHLKLLVDEMTLPDNFGVIVEGNETFEAAFDRHYPKLLNRRGRLPPTFAFIDPFGWTGAPFRIVREIMQHPSCEVLVNFMYEEVNRFLGHPDQARNFDEFFGCDDWKPILEISEPRQRNRELHDLYARQLHRDAGVEYVRSFEMRNERDVTDYFLFYGTNSLLGLKKMKEAMWRIDEGGEFQFSDATNPDQFVLFQKAPDFALLRRQVVERFVGKRATVGEIEHFVVSETAFRETHYKRQILRTLENEGLLKVPNAPPNRRHGTFSDRNLTVFIEIEDLSERRD